MEKTCTKCLQVFPATAAHFHRHPVSADGLKTRCKDCQCSAEAARYQAKSDDEKATFKSQVASWRAANKPRTRAASDKWIRNNPQKRRAQQMVAVEIRSGRMARCACERCGSANAQAHHDDYSKPLDVRWLCPRDHARAHAEARRQNQVAC